MEYMQYVECVRRYVGMPDMTLDTAVARAVEECIEKGILADFLRKNKAEVVSVSIFEYNEAEEKEKLRKAEYSVGYNDGVEAGYNDGVEAGYNDGVADGYNIGIIEGLVCTCEELKLSFEETLTKLKKKHSLNNEEARKYMNMYWK